MRNRAALLDLGLWGLSFALMTAAVGLIFFYAPTEREMGDIQRIFYFHVPLAWIAFLAFFIVALCGALYLWKREPKWDAVAHSSAEIGVLFTTLVLITGPLWARPVWGSWWEWEARLTSSLVLWMIYLAYLLVRGYAAEEERGARFAAVVGIIGFLDVPIVYLSVNLWRTQHPPELVSDLGGAMLFTLIVSLFAFTVLFIVLLRQRTAVRMLERRLKSLRRRM